MKIVTLHTDFRIYWPARLKALAKSLHNRGDALEVIEIAGKGSPYAFAGNGGKDDSDLSWHILFPDSKPEELSGKIIEPVLFRELESINPDVIIAGAIAYPSGALAVRWGQLHKRRIISFDDSKIDVVKRNPAVTFIKQQIYNGVDAMFYPSEDLIPTGAFWGFNNDQMYFGVNVVDNDFWSQPTITEKPSEKYFINVGRQIPLKNLKTLINAYITYIEKVGIDDAIDMVIVGEGSDHDELQAMVSEHSLQNKVKFLPFKTQQELAGLYQNAEALCIPSLRETWGLVINEALSASCPVFASKQCAASNILIKDGFNGYSFDCNDADALADILVRYHSLSDKEKQDMHANCHIIMDQWGLPKFSASLINAIDYVVAHPKRKTNPISRLVIARWKGQYNPE